MPKQTSELVSHRNNLGKYRDLVIAIALFLLPDLGVLVLNFFASTLIETDAARINIASELRMLSQQMTKPLLTMKEELREQAPIQTSWAQLSEASQQFDRNIAALKQPPVQSTGAHLIGKLFSGDERALRTAGVGSSYLAEPAQVLPKADFSGMVELSGRYRGWVCFSATRGLLSQVLMAMGLGSDYSDAGHLDLAGEIANTMIGQAQRHFGDDLERSVPKTFSGNATRLVSESQSRPVLLPMTWNGYEAVLAIHMNQASDTAA